MVTPYHSCGGTALAAFDIITYLCGRTALAALEKNTYSCGGTALVAFQINILPLWWDDVGGIRDEKHSFVT